MSFNEKITVEQLKEKLSDVAIMLLDIRETHEYEYEHIPGSLLCPMSFFDTETFPYITHIGIVVICKAGKRSAIVAKQLSECPGYKIYDLDGGIDAWIKAGYETEGKKHEVIDFSI